MAPTDHTRTRPTAAANRSRTGHIDTPIGPQRLCRGCEMNGEPDPYWPVDEEFWFFIDGRPAGRCRACWSERPHVNGRRRFVPLVAV